MAADAQDFSASGGKVASLGPYLLARKGGAKPAMRPSQNVAQLDPDADDLGWNDSGEDLPAQAGEPEVKRQQSRLVHHIAEHNQAAAKRPERRPAAKAAEAHRAAFTLRLDSERHLRLRLACTVAGESAQVLVTRALDEFLARTPDIDHLAARIRSGATSKA